MCRDIHRVFDSQCHKRQIKKERIKRVMKHKSLYHVVQEQKELKAMTSKMFTETFINLKLLINNDLKRKQKHSTNESHLLNVIIIFKNTILNHLIKKSKTNELLKSAMTNSFLAALYRLASEKRLHVTTQSH